MGTVAVATTEPPRRTPTPLRPTSVTAERGDLLQISNRDEAIWRRGPSAKLPKIGRIKAKPADDQTLTVSWTGYDPGDTGEALRLQWSDDKGETWRGLATGVHDHEVTVHTTGLPAGTVLVRALLHDGFDTAASRPTLGAD